MSGLLASLALLAIGAVVGSALVTSPQEAALNAGPPPPSTITARVERRPVSQDVVVRGSAQPATVVSALPLSLPEGATVAVLSQPLPAVGDEFEAGARVAEISGRPVIVLPGKVPQFRPLAVGLTGADVSQLQDALGEIGFSIDDPAGVLGSSTWAAVGALYKRAGATAPVGETLPVGEVLFLPGFPVGVIESVGGMGDSVSDSVLRLASGAVRVTAAIPAGQRELVNEGAAVSISSESLGEEASGTVGKPALLGDGSRGVEIVPDAPLGPTWADQGVRVRIVSASTSGEVLAVPVAALFMGGDGSAELVMIDDESVAPPRTHRVPVDVGVVGGGYAEVAAKGGAQALEPGKTVLLSGVEG